MPLKISSTEYRLFNNQFRFQFTHTHIATNIIIIEAKFKEFKPRHWTAKTGSNWAPAQILKHWIQFHVEPTMFEPRLKFETRLKFFKSGLWFYNCLLFNKFTKYKEFLRDKISNCFHNHRLSEFVCRVNHKEWNFRDDCTECKLSVSLYQWCPTTLNLFLPLTDK